MNYVFPGKEINIHNLSTVSFVECLKKNEVNNGFADFWDASSATVLSDSRIIVRPVVFQRERLEIFPFLVSKNWYRNKIGEYFIAIPAAKKTEIIGSTLGDQLLLAKRKFQCQDKEVYVFNGNSNKLFKQSTYNINFINNTSSEYIINESKNIFLIDKSKSGFILYGNYTKIDSGDYILKYTVTSKENNSELNCGYVDIVYNLGNNIINKFNIGSNSNSNIINIPENTDSLEIRLFSNGQCNLTGSNKIVLISAEK
jgi:hypothetical protein